MCKNSLFLRETYQPYKTYLLGSNSGLNNLNYSIAGDNNLFVLQSGKYAYRSTLNYTFPIISNLDKQWLILYFTNISGEMVVGHGGVMQTLSVKSATSCFSASFAAKATIDIKGFQIWPSIAYGKILNGKGSAFFTELSFSQFF